MADNRLQYIFDLLKGKNEVTPELKKIQEDSLKITKTIAKAGVLTFAAFATAIGGAVNAAAGFEDIAVQFEVLTGSVEGSKEAMDQLQAFAASTPFQFEGVAQAGQQLLGFGFQVEDMTALLSNIGDVAAASGKPITDLSLIFGQVAAAGKLTGERLLQFQERAIPIGPALAKTLGVAESAVKDLVSSGVVDFETFQKAFQSLSKEGGFAFDGLSKKSDTLNGKISTLGDVFNLLAGEVGKEFIPAFKDAVDVLTEFLRKILDNKPLLDFITNILKIGVAAGGIIATLFGVASAVTSVKVALIGLKLAGITTFSVLKATLISTGIGAIIVGIGIAIALLAANWETNVLYMTAVWDAFGNFFSSVSARFTEKFEAVVGKLPALFENVVTRMRARWESLVTFITDSGELIKTILQGALDLDLSKAGEAFDEFGKKNADNFEKVSKKVEEAEKKYEDFSKAAEKARNIPKIDFKIDLTAYNKALKEIDADNKISKDVAPPSSKVVVPVDIQLDPEKLKAAQKNPFKFLFGDKEIDLSEKIGIGSGVAAAITQGAKGAANLLTSGVSAGLDVLLPGIGAAAKPLLDAFSQGPEATKQMVKDFTAALPELAKNLILAVPAFIEALIEETPRMIESMVEQAPRVIASLVGQAPRLISALVSQTPQIVSAIATGIFVALGDAGSFLIEQLKDFPRILFNAGVRAGNAILKGIISAFNAVFDVLGNIGSSVTDFLGFHEGGKIPQGFNNDNFPMTATSGEYVIDKSLTSRLENFLGQQGGQTVSQSNGQGPSSTLTNSLLSSILSALINEQSITTSVNFNQDTLAEIMVNLNRTGTRTV